MRGMSELKRRTYPSGHVGGIIAAISLLLFRALRDLLIITRITTITNTTKKSRSRQLQEQQLSDNPSPTNLQMFASRFF
jgi:hypothetical protein